MSKSNYLFLVVLALVLVGCPGRQRWSDPCRDTRLGLFGVECPHPDHEMSAGGKTCRCPRPDRAPSPLPEAT